jgi:hypothetical protein
MLAVVEDFISPTVSRQHGYEGEDIGDVDEEGFKDDDIEPQVSVVDGWYGCSSPLC